MIKQHRQRAERLQTDDGDGGKADIAPARGAIEHPSRDLEPSLAVRTIDRTAKYRAIRLVDGIVNEDFVTCPRVKAIQDLATSGPVGILKPCSTTSGARIRRLTGARLTRPTSPNRKRRWPHDRRRRFCRSSGRATPSRRRDKIETPRVQQTPAEIHSKSAGTCPDKRGQLFYEPLKLTPRCRH